MKKPKIKKDGYLTMSGGFTLCVCPNCHTMLCKREDRMYKFCPYCGQPLNWDSEKEEDIMTNFEKWKQQLIVEELLDTFPSVYCECELCPASSFCKNNKYKSCRDNFEEWANSPVGEEGLIFFTKFLKMQNVIMFQNY